MGKTYKIVAIDNNMDLSNGIKNYYGEEGEFKVVESFNDVQTAVEYIESNEVDVVVTDLLLSNADGFYLLEQLKEKDVKMPKIIIASAIFNDDFVKKAFTLGANYYMVKPLDYKLLDARMRELLEGDNVSIQEIRKPAKNKQLEEKITNIFITVGIPAHIKGYQFLREAIKMAIDNPDIINSITKRLYPSIAERFETSSSKVERAIRHAIEVAWNRGKIENINSLFGIRVYSNNEKPTNGEFIALVADKMLIEGA